MAEYRDREHYIPIRRHELLELLCNDSGPTRSEPLPPEDQDGLRRFSEILGALLHHTAHAQLERLKEAYAPFDPDADTKSLKALTEDQKQKRLDQLFGDLNSVLEKANYRRLSREEIQAAMAGASYWGLDMDVDFSVFDRLEMYYRGDMIGQRSRRSIWRFYREEIVSVPIFRRLVVILRQAEHKRLGKNPDTNSVFVKFFKDIPKCDLEMLFPGTRVKMPLADRGKLGISMLSAIGMIIWKLFTDFTVLAAGVLTKNPVALYGPLSLVLGYGYKQYYGFQVTRQTYQLMLTQSLYYQNLDNNAGVMFRLVDEAEDQEYRECLLGYYFLWRYGKDGWTSEQLDEYIEMDLERQAGVKVDFEIADALGKLERMQLIERSGDRYRALPLPRALEQLDQLWDNLFTYNNTRTSVSAAV